jgi:hypothetical protein
MKGLTWISAVELVTHDVEIYNPMPVGRGPVITPEYRRSFTQWEQKRDRPDIIVTPVILEK